MLRSKVPGGHVIPIDAIKHVAGGRFHPVSDIEPKTPAQAKKEDHEPLIVQSLKAEPVGAHK